MADTERSKTHPGRRRVGFPAAVAIALVTAAAAGGFTLLTAHQSAAARPVPRAQAARRPHSAPAHHRATPPAAIRVVSVSPRPGAKGVNFQAEVTVRFSQPLAPMSPLPRLSPSIPGSWTRAGADEVVFHPIGSYAPFSSETLVVPGGARGVLSTAGGRLAAKFTSRFSVRAASVLRLQQLLAELGYLPVNFTQSANVPSPSSTTTTVAKLPPLPTGPPGPSGTVLSSAPPTPPPVIDEPSKVPDISLAPLPGTFAWRYANIPPSLAALWTPGRYNVITVGAVMQFEAANGLATDGVAGPLVWAALLKAVATRQLDQGGYNYVYVSTGTPEYVNLWRNGEVIFQTLANTGIPQAPTAPGTWPVFLRFVTTTMSGTEPNGQTYSDPGIPWVSYFHGGDALHGFLRAQYGFPQSLGCVEMPYSSAQAIYPFTPIGTLVTVL